MGRRARTIFLWLLYTMAIVAFFQCMRMTLQIYAAQRSFKELRTHFSSDGEAKVKSKIVEAMEYAGIEVDPNAISIKKSRSGEATIDLVATVEAKILLFQVSREVKFHSKVVYDPGFL